MSSNFKVRIVILQYNNSLDTVKCLESVAQLDYPPPAGGFEVIVVDNASAANDLEVVKNWISNQYSSTVHYSLITNHSNTGYAGGNNLGIKYALEHGADYVLILNPDTTVEKDLLTKLVHKAESDRKVGIIAPIIIETNHSNILKNVGMILDQENSKIYGGKIQWLKPELRHIEWHNFKDNTFERPHKSIVADKLFLTGACLLIKKQVFEDIGLFDERYFLYFEDADFCLRVQQAGYKLAIVEDAVIQHQVSASTSKLGSSLLLRYHYRNAHLFNFKNGPWWVILSLPFWSILIIIRQLIKLILLPSKRIASLSIIRGVFDFYSWKFGKIK